MGVDVLLVVAVGFSLAEVLKRFVPYALLPEAHPVFDQDRAKFLIAIGGFALAAWIVPMLSDEPITDPLALFLGFLSQMGLYKAVRDVVPFTASLRGRVPDPLNNRLNGE